MQKQNPDEPYGSSGLFNPGNDLVSHAVARAVPSAQGGLTSVFGMGTGVTLPVRPPENGEVPWQLNIEGQVERLR